MNPESTPRRRLALSLLIGLLFLIMLPNLAWLVFGHDLEHPVIAPLILPVAFLLVLFAILGGRWLWVACLLLLPFALLAPLEAFYIHTYGRPTFAEIIATLIATNPREMREYVGALLIPLVVTFLICMALAVAAVVYARRARLQLPGRVRIGMAVVAALLPLAVGIHAGIAAKGAAGARFQAGLKQEADLVAQIQYGWPFGLIPRLIDYRREWDDMRANVDRLGNFHFHAYRIRPQRQRQVYVLVIGEASRRDHWQLFGYDRPTNPELAKTANLVRVTDLDSAWPESITAIPMILTRKPATITSFTWWKEASILRAMQEAGYETYWISNQQAIGKYDSPVSTFAFEAQHQMFLNHASWSVPGAYDGVLLQALRDVLRDSNKDLFIVLHLMGNHQSYDYRYPDAFKRWRPTESDPWQDEAADDSADDSGSDSADSASASDEDSGDDSADDSPDPESIQRTTNSYDNSILYTDHILASIIGILRQNGAMSALWFESDHGESLLSDTCQMEGHGHGTIYEYALPVLFWFSDSYAQAFPDKLAALRANADKRTMSENTFESLADMAGVGFPGHDPSWSLFSPHWRYHPRIVNRPAQGNIDTASIGKECGTVHQAAPTTAPSQASPTHEQAMDGPASPTSTATRRPPG